jgi:hypothetical protein
VKPALPFIAAIAILASSSAFAAGEKRSAQPKACTFDMCYASALKHGHQPSAAAGWCHQHLAIGDACKNVGK